MNNNNYHYQRNKESLLEQAKNRYPYKSAKEQATNRYHHEGGKEQEKEYYESNKEKLQEQSQNKYRESSDKKDTYGRYRYRIMRKINMLKKNYCEAKKISLQKYYFVYSIKDE